MYNEEHMICDESDRPYRDGVCPFSDDFMDKLGDEIYRDIIDKDISELLKEQGKTMTA